MPRAKAVVFDQDGTLINTFIPAMHAYSVAVGREITYEQLKPVAHLGAARNLVSALLGHEASDADDDRFHDALREAVGGIHPYTGVVELLAHLRERGVPVAVATNSDSRSAGIVLGTHGLDAYVQSVATVDRVGVPKPAPDLLLLASEELGVAPSEVAFVGDSPADMAAARAADAYAVVAGWGQQVADITDYDFWAVAPRDVLTLLG
ncbi:MAG: HAD family phosphatase [Candidatus Nanopelagicales bacterium]